MWAICSNYVGRIWNVYNGRAELFPRTIDQAIQTWNFSKSIKVLQGIVKEIWDGELQRDNYTIAIGCYLDADETGINGPNTEDWLTHSYI